MFVPLTAPEDDVDALGEDDSGKGEEAGAASVMRRDYRFGDLAINPKLGAIWRTIVVRSVKVGANWREFDSPSANVGAIWRKLDPPSVNVGAIWREFDAPSVNVGAFWRKLPAKSVVLDAKRQKVSPLRSRSEPHSQESRRQLPDSPPDSAENCWLESIDLRCRRTLASSALDLAAPSTCNASHEAPGENLPSKEGALPHPFYQADSFAWPSWLSGGWNGPK